MVQLATLLRGRAAPDQRSDPGLLQSRGVWFLADGLNLQSDVSSQLYKNDIFKGEFIA